jgi:DNA polymerase-1
MDNNFLRYNALDSACTLQAHNEFWDELKSGFDSAYDMTEDIIEPLMFLQARGIRVDLKALEETKLDILRTASERQEELNKIVGRELNVNSSQQCQAYFYGELGIQPYYKDGKVTIDDISLQRISRGTAKRPGLRAAKLVQDIRGLNKLHGTYLDIAFDSDSRLRCSYNPRGTKFGRLSSSKTVFGTGTNNQNLPQEFKKFLQADPGYIFWEVDKRQAEWVVMAYLTQDANMISVVEAGKDTHIHTASLMFGVEPEVIEYESKLVGSNSDPDLIHDLRFGDEILARFGSALPRTMSGRQCGKKSNHGLNYDEGPNQFALINEIEPAEAKRIVEMYHSIYPGIRNYYEWIKRQLQKDRALTNCFGRRVRFMDAWGAEMWKSAYSMLPQSTVVDSLNQGMVQIYNDPLLCAVGGYNIDILAQVHDSILMQIPISVVMSANFELVQEGVYARLSPELHYNGRSFKIATDMKMGFNWGGYHKERNPLGMRDIKDLSEARQLVELVSEPKPA